MAAFSRIIPIKWQVSKGDSLWRGSAVAILDQRRLPRKKVYIQAQTPAEVARAIRLMVLRGAPLIGVAAAYGMALAPEQSRLDKPESILKAVRRAARILKASRPTAVALACAVDRMLSAARRPLAGRSRSSRHLGRQVGVGDSDTWGVGDADPWRCSELANKFLAPSPRKYISKLLKAEADLIAMEERKASRGMARLGAGLLPRNSVVITYCNTGCLATLGLGTALGVIRQAHQKGRVRMVYACETRPYLQGCRLTMWELLQDRIPCRLITDNMAGHIMATERIDAVLVGADRIAANGDVANKIGTYTLAVMARRHGVPFYVVAPMPTIDYNLPSGRLIPIEERPQEEVLTLAGRRIAPRNARARHPAFDVTPAQLVTALITDKSVIRKPTASNLKKLKG